MSKAGAHLQRVEVESRAGLRAWLEANHARPDSVWLVTWKKADPLRYLAYDAIVEELLCFGWIDSVPRKLDEARTMVLISPRKPGSAWSAVNKARVARLDEAGLIRPPGRAAIERAKADGSWDALAEVETLEPPDDLRAALARLPGSAEAFAGFSRSSRRSILEWISLAKTPETRARRIEETAEKAARGIKANHPPGRDRG